eukprot:1160783-Pelagomonas_calceolata.AAC.5
MKQDLQCRASASAEANLANIGSKVSVGPYAEILMSRNQILKRMERGGIWMPEQEIPKSTKFSDQHTIFSAAALVISFLKSAMIVSLAVTSEYSASTCVRTRECMCMCAHLCIYVSKQQLVAFVNHPCKVPCNGANTLA